MSLRLYRPGPDGLEPNYNEDTDGDGIINALEPLLRAEVPSDVTWSEPRARR